jgi:hypothetical protein
LRNIEFNVPAPTASAATRGLARLSFPKIISARSGDAVRRLGSLEVEYEFEFGGLHGKSPGLATKLF